MEKLLNKTDNKPKVIFVGAHPDDIELGCGGTIPRFVEEGYEVWCVYLTKGEKGQVTGDDPKARLNESTEACMTLGVDKQKIIFGDFEDTCIPNSIETIHFLEQFYFGDPTNLYGVFIPNAEEKHQDHRAAAEACITAFRYVPRMLAYESPSTTSAFNGTSFVDITRYVKIKSRALKCHESQIRRNKIYFEY
ncbi:MAG: PIG-L family deacetylase, partial [Candidatus Omnitrophota bacterium]